MLKQLGKVISRFYHIHDYDMGFNDTDGIGMGMELACECGDTARTLDEAMYKMNNSIRIFWVKIFLTGIVVCSLGSYIIMELVG